ncbi:protein MAIN-LIKE 1-like [Spinacia oleracea]|uniref:Protein MAIN-LIKE 1-like n=1 Tax=Spinacia oleracea TaxID=3562 RepID=A0ABM3RGX6_SPIOL|nr:protein MAIN-LIKE 1-like [Spinacia oleracea]
MGIVGVLQARDDVNVARDDVASDDDFVPDVVSIMKGEGGKFVRSESSTARMSKRQKQLANESWIVRSHISGGPVDGSVIPSFGGHVARQIWDGEERKVLLCQNRSQACSTLNYWRESEESQELKRRVDATGLAHLPYCMFAHIDMPLISAFVERWQPDTNTFHMSFGEMTIMLHDVWHILRIPVDGRLISAQSDSVQLKVDMIELLGVSVEDMKSQSHWRGGGVAIDSIVDYCRDSQRSVETSVVGWMLLMLGTSLFVDKSGSRLRPASILELKDGGVESIAEYSWGSATLCYLYHQLGVASRGGAQGIAGCLTLLQAWIYEYFPTFRPHTSRLTCEPGRARAVMWSIRNEGKSLVRTVTWLPYGPDPASTVPRTTFCGWLRYRDIIKPYTPDRVLRQLGYVQVIPSPILTPEFAYRPIESHLYEVRFSIASTESAWQMFPRGFRLFLAEFQIAEFDPSTCSSDYLLWLVRYSHPGVANVDHAGAFPDRTNAPYWVERLFRAIQPLLDARDVMPSEESRAAVDDVEQIIYDWNMFAK